MEKTDQKQPETLTLTEDQKKIMTEDLILTGRCSYSFNIASVPVEIHSLAWKEQKELTSKLSSVPRSTETRELSVAEFSGLSSELILKSQLQSFNGQENVDLDKMSATILEMISKKIRLLNNTIVGLVTYENLPG